MKNYLVKSLFKIKDPNWSVVDRSHENNLYDDYVGMHQVSLGSYTKHLGGEWDFKFISGTCDNIHQAFEKTFWAIHELWHKEPCNILYTDPDTIAVKAVNIWDKYDNFMMFNHTDPKEFNKPNLHNKYFPHFFNAGVRYFPHTMKESIWELGCGMARPWDYSTYDTEQIILNTMLWDQSITLDQALDPAVSWQWFTDRTVCEAWNGLSMDDAQILHLHSSRGAKNRLKVMQDIARNT